jgi:hypothetical protein
MQANFTVDSARSALETHITVRFVSLFDVCASTRQMRHSHQILKELFSEPPLPPLPPPPPPPHLFIFTDTRLSLRRKRRCICHRRRQRTVQVRSRNMQPLQPHLFDAVISPASYSSPPLLGAPYTPPPPIPIVALFIELRIEPSHLAPTHIFFFFGSILLHAHKVPLNSRLR